MITGPKFTAGQWKLLASALSNISQAIILFALASFTVPEAVSLSRDFSRMLALLFLTFGLLILLIAIIISKRSK